MKEIDMTIFVAVAIFWGLTFISNSLNSIAKQMCEANNLKRAELIAMGAKLD